MRIKSRQTRGFHCLITASVQSHTNFVMFHVYCFMLIVSLIICGSSCSIIKPPRSCLSDDLQLHKIRCCGPCLYTVTYYKRKYLSRRIPYASNGSFNPYIITNKEAHLVNGNPALSKDSNSRKSSQTKPHLQERFGKEISQSLPRSFLPVEQMHFRNYCLDFPGKFSCAIDCFMELSCYIFKDAIESVERNEFFEMLYTV